VTTPAEVVPHVPSPLTLRVAEGLAEVDVFVELVVALVLLVVAGLVAEDETCVPHDPEA
jgi:hypothetical protein